MKTLLSFIWNNITYFLLAGVVILFCVVSYSCSNNKEKVKQQEVELFKKDSLINVITKNNIKLKADLKTCEDDQQKIKDSYVKAQKDYVTKIISFRESVSKLTTSEKQAKLLLIAKQVISNQNAEINALQGKITTDTLFLTQDSTVVPLGTVKLGDKEFPYYTEEQQNLLLWAVGEGQILQESNSDTKQAKAFYDSITEAIAKKTLVPIEGEIHSRHFLGIGQKKALKELKEELVELFKQYKIKLE